ncbi:hypothetical protein GF325_05665, partial [Candidatus Bathyarchaeota archaeon]|nr:hypothetical protein [Candidatus Bathyarchaeota archaeon]
MVARDILCFGHRGAMGYEPENTLLGFKTAIQMEVDGIELDVYKSRDGKMVVSHLDALEIEGKRYRITKLDIDEIKTIELEKNQKIPTLREVIECANDLNPSLLFSIDLKDIRAIKDYCKELSSLGVLDRTFTCLESRIFLKKAARTCPGLHLVYSTHVGPSGSVEDLHKVDKEMVEVINLPHQELDGNIVKSIQEAGFKCFAWDVND